MYVGDLKKSWICSSLLYIKTDVTKVQTLQLIRETVLRALS